MNETDLHAIEFHDVLSEEGAAVIAALARRIWPEHYAAIIGMNQVEYMLTTLQSVEAIQRDLRDHALLYTWLEYKKEPVGYVAIRPDPDSNTLFLSKFYLDKRVRGLGLGRRMLEHIESRYSPASIWLTVNRNNHNTIDIYRHLGFHVEGSKVAEIGSGFIMDDFIMRKTI